MFLQEHLTRTFVMHYSRIPSVLEMSRDPDTLSNRVVHMSVQLFSNESLALKMVNELSLLHVMIISLKLMMSKILIQNTLHGMCSTIMIHYRSVFKSVSLHICRSHQELSLCHRLYAAGDEGSLLLAPRIGL